MQGSCLCGGVTFTVSSAPTSPPSACHCGQCRSQTSYAFASATVPRSALRISGESLKWFRASPDAERGFCANCGSMLFWRHDDEDTMSYSIGALMKPSGLRIERHIFTADKGDYYDIVDGLPQS